MYRPMLQLALRVVMCLMVALNAAAATKHIVLIAGQKSHEPGGHEYLESIKLLKVLLDRAPNLKDIETEIYFNGWPDDESVLDRADTVAILSDGENAGSPFATDEHMKVLAKEMQRGCGLVTFHWATFTSEKYAPKILEWTGGYFDYQTGHGEGGHFGETGYEHYHSLVRDIKADIELGTPHHPILQGVTPFHLKDEFYYQLVFRDKDSRLQPILRAPLLAPKPEDQIVAWAVERANGGRGFGTTTGHYFSNWRNNDYRKMILNALVWTAGMEVPSGGVPSSYADVDEVNRFLMTRPIRTLLTSGAVLPDADREKLTSEVVAALNSEVPRFEVQATLGPEILQRDLSQYKLIVLADCDGLRSEEGREAQRRIIRYVRAGGALTILYFPRGHSLSAPDSTPALSGPEWHQICKQLIYRPTRPVEQSPQTLMSSVWIEDRNHPISRNVVDWEMYRANTTDDLDIELVDPDLIHVIARVQSRGTGRPVPMSFTSSYGRGRIDHLIIGRDIDAIQIPPMTQLLRYGSLWVAEP